MDEGEKKLTKNGIEIEKLWEGKKGSNKWKEIKKKEEWK